MCWPIPSGFTWLPHFISIIVCELHIIALVIVNKSTFSDERAETGPERVNSRGRQDLNAGKSDPGFFAHHCTICLRSDGCISHLREDEAMPDDWIAVCASYIFFLLRQNFDVNKSKGRKNYSLSFPVSSPFWQKRCGTVGHSIAVEKPRK